MNRETPGNPLPATPDASVTPGDQDYFRFHKAHERLGGPFGTSGFGKQAEAFARFFGTPQFLIGQTLIVAVWIAANSIGMAHFDIYPFILLNLAFSLQAAYAAPLILLAQTRQADRDKAHADADARHREDLSRMGLERQEVAARQGAQIRELLVQNTALTQQVQKLTGQIETLTREIHLKICAAPR